MGVFGSAVCQLYPCSDARFGFVYSDCTLESSNLLFTSYRLQLLQNVSTPAQPEHLHWKAFVRCSDQFFQSSEVAAPSGTKPLYSHLNSNVAFSKSSMPC